MKVNKGDVFINNRSEVEVVVENYDEKTEKISFHSGKELKTLTSAAFFQNYERVDEPEMSITNDFFDDVSRVE